MNTTTTTHHLCCSVSAAGIVFGTSYPFVVCIFSLIPFCVWLMLLLQILQVLRQFNTAASSTTGSRSSSSSQCDFHSLPGENHQHEYIVITRTQKKLVLIVDPKAAAAEAARPPQPVEHHAHSVYLAVQTLRWWHWLYSNKMSRNTSNRLDVFQLTSSYPYHREVSVRCFLLPWDSLSNGHDLFLRNKHNAYEHMHPPHMTRAYFA